MKVYYSERQHISLSQTAFDTIESDQYEFLEKPSRQGLINRIIENFAEESAASIDEAVRRYHQRLAEMLKHVPESQTKQRMLSIITDSYRADLEERMKEYPIEKSFKFQLNEKNYEAKEMWKDEKGYYGGQIGKFYKAVLEEYARKSYYEREYIVLRELINEIELNIAASKLIIVTLRGPKKRRFEVRPYSISSDPLKSFHYLVGLSKEINSPQSPEKIASFRVSRVAEVKTSAKRSGKITNDQKKSIKDKIENVGVQFLTQESEVIRVRLNADGKHDFERQASLRPHAMRVEAAGDNWIYTFGCSLMQAEYYFFKFGNKAEILEPLELRQLFISKYESAVNSYKMEK